MTESCTCLTTTGYLLQSIDFSSFQYQMLLKILILIGLLRVVADIELDRVLLLFPRHIMIKSIHLTTIEVL